MYEICSSFLPAIQRVGELSECISALDRGLLSNMLLFVATEFIKQIDGAEDWALGFGVLPCCS